MKGFMACLLLVSLQVPATSRDLDYIDTADQVYHFLDQAWAGGYIRYLPQVRPYTREAAVDLLGVVIAESTGTDTKMAAWMGNMARQHRDRLTDSRRDLLRYEFQRDGFVSVDANVEFNLDSALSRIEDSIVTGVGPFGIGLGLGGVMFLGLDVIPALAYWGWTEEPYPLFGDPVLSDYYVYTQPLESGTGTFNLGGYHELGAKELRILFDTFNQFSLDLDYVKLHAARGTLDWGPGHLANLILSKTAKAYDYISAEMPLGESGRFSWMTGILQDFAYDGGGSIDERLLTAHRIEYQITRWLYLSIYESVVYDFSFELAYLNPLAVYYVTEVTQGSDDNKLGGADVVFLLPYLKLYISFFADDWDAGRLFAFNNSHNEWAAIFGAHYYGFYPGLSLLLEYSYVSHWMYTHYTWSGISSTGRSYQHYGSHMGHFLEPNSHMLYFESRYDINAESWIILSFWFTQDGRGDINSPPDWGAESALHGVDDYRDIYYSFLDAGKPGFTIDTNLDWSISGNYALPDTGLTFWGKYTIQHEFSQYTEDMSRVPGGEKVEHYLTLAVRWNPGFLRAKPTGHPSK